MLCRISVLGEAAPSDTLCHMLKPSSAGIEGFSLIPKIDIVRCRLTKLLLRMKTTGHVLKLLRKKWKKQNKFTCKIEEGWVPVCHMKHFFALDPSPLQHFAMNKAHTPDPSLPEAEFVSTKGPVISSKLRNATIIS